MKAAARVSGGDWSREEGGERCPQQVGREKCPTVFAAAEDAEGGELSLPIRYLSLNFGQLWSQ